MIINRQGAFLLRPSLAPFLHTDDHPGRLSVAAKLHAACLDYGFFYLDLSTWVEEGEPKELQRLAREFFAQSQEQKDRIALTHQDGARGEVPPCPYHWRNPSHSTFVMSGYQRLKENVTNGKADNHEAIDFYRPVDRPDKSRPLWGENQVCVLSRLLRSDFLML